MTKENTEKLINKLYEIGFEDAICKSQWKKYCEEAKKENIETNFQILYSIVELNEMIKKGNFKEAHDIISNDKMFDSKQNRQKAKTGLKLLEYGKLYLQNRLISKGSAIAKDKEKWIEFCDTLAPKNKYKVVENILNTLSKIDDGKKSFLEVKKEVMADSYYVENIKAICDGLRHFKKGKDFSIFLKEKRNTLTGTEKKPYKLNTRNI